MCSFFVNDFDSIGVEYGDDECWDTGTSPTEIDIQWLKDTIHDLCNKSNQPELFPEICQELVKRNFIPQDDLSEIGDHSKDKFPINCGSLSQVYDTLEVIGEGGYGKVLKIHNLVDQQIYALKIINLEPYEVETAVHEVQCLAHLNFPNVLRYYSSWLEESETVGLLSLCIQTEFIDGISLSSYLSTRKFVDLPTSHKILVDIINALESIHSAGVVHRDFRPSNIMIRTDGSIVVIDFGISSVRRLPFERHSESPPLPVTTQGRIGSLTVRPLEQFSLNVGQNSSYTMRKVGTPLYSSPQQLNGKKSCKEDDIYSFGIVMFEILYGFKTETEKAKVIQQLRNKAVLPEKFSKDFPEESKMIIKLTDHNPKNRMSAKDVLQSNLFSTWKNEAKNCKSFRNRLFK